MTSSLILIGIDDTDSLESRGTNKLARELAARVSDKFRCRYIVRHQLLFDERIPFTSHNGSASIWLEPRRGEVTDAEMLDLFDELRAGMLADFIAGSDPGLCLATSISPEIIAWGQRCQREIVKQSDARELAVHCGVRMQGLGGTEGGVIGALAAIGLAATGDDGRIVQLGEWRDDLSGPTSIARLNERGLEIRELNNAEAENPRPTRQDGRVLADGLVDVGKHARANLRDGRSVLFVCVNDDEFRHVAEWRALKIK